MKYKQQLILVIGLLSLLFCSDFVRAEIKLPAIFGDQMVLQREQEVNVCGTASPDAKVQVALADQTKTIQADSQGTWSLKLAPMPAGGPFQMTIQEMNSTAPPVKFKEVMIGEVWVCSGQSNMARPLSKSTAPEQAVAAANHPNIRLLTVPYHASATPLDEFEASWASCTPELATDFTAVGYYFGRKLHQELDGIAIGLISVSKGGSSVEAWIREDLLLQDVDAKHHQARLSSLEKMQAEKDERYRSQHEMSRLYNGMIHPLLVYTIRGVIWYQGETNASRAWQYRRLFPLMIQNWRNDWKQGDFPFYFVQLANYKKSKPQPAESDWAEMREAQGMTLSLPKTGQAVIIDIGEANDIHPVNKQDVGERLARWALKNDYGKDVVVSGPTVKSFSFEENVAIIVFDYLANGLVTLGNEKLTGFALAGEDKIFHWANAEIIDNRVRVTSPEVARPIAIRYAWADNPLCNLYNTEQLPASPFRTDNWKGITTNNR